MLKKQHEKDILQIITVLAESLKIWRN